MDACRECVEARTALAEEFRRLWPLFVALGDENRQRVFLALLEADQVGLRAEEIAKRTNRSRPAVSRHLRTLRAAGAVELYRDGTRTYYYPNAAASCWAELRKLSGHICAVTENAAAEGYPNTEEEL